MIIPPYIKKGDKIRIVAPAGRIKKEFVLQGAEWLKQQGYQVEIGKYTLGEHFQFAGNDEDRQSDMQEALNDPEAKVIICARGGYGSARLLGKLDFFEFVQHPKWIVGFSDITVFHNLFNKLGFSSIHGPMLRHFPKADGKISESVNSLFSLLEGKKNTYQVKAHSYNRQGIVSAELVGGNLSIIYSLMGTPYDLNTQRKILFIEDIGEHHYQTDRMINSLKQSGKLKKLAGLIVGDFSKMKDSSKDFGKGVSEIIADAVDEYNYPVSFGFPAGHAKKNLALAMGMIWELNIDKNESLLKMV